MIQYTNNHWIDHFKMLNFSDHELYLNFWKITVAEEKIKNWLIFYSFIPPSPGLGSTGG